MKIKLLWGMQMGPQHRKLKGNNLTVMGLQTSPKVIFSAIVKKIFSMVLCVKHKSVHFSLNFFYVCYIFSHFSRS